MIRSAAGKVMWVGRATVFLVGLAVILALVFGAATSAMGADGKPFLLGKRNVATLASKLINRGEGPALSLRVGEGQPPLAVNSQARVANLNAATAGRADSAANADNAANAQNADNAAKLDGKPASDYVRSDDPRLGAPTITLDVSSNSSISWLIGRSSDYHSGSNVNPTLVLQRGLTYRFDVKVFGHPFRIASSASGPAYNVGVTNNDVMGGVLTFKVPMDAPSQLHYYCLAHPNMNGVINIQ